MSDDNLLYAWGAWAKSGKVLSLTSNISIMYKIASESIRPQYTKPMHRQGIKAAMAKLYTPTAPSQPRRAIVKSDIKDYDMLTELEKVDKVIMSLDDDLKKTACYYYRDHPRASRRHLLTLLKIEKSAFYERLSKIKRIINNI